MSVLVGFSMRIMCSVRRDLLEKNEIFKQRVQSSDASWESCFHTSQQ